MNVEERKRDLTNIFHTPTLTSASSRYSMPKGSGVAVTTFLQGYQKFSDRFQTLFLDTLTQC